MRKALIIVAVALLLLPMLALPVFAAEAEAAEAHAWWEVWRQIDFDALRVWLSGEVLPHATSVTVILGVALAELIPAVRGLIKAKNAFGRVAADVDDYTKSKREYDARMEALQKQQIEEVEKLNAAVERYERQLGESEERLAAMLRHATHLASQTERMVCLGLSNQNELIYNGAARRIVQIDREEEADGNAEHEAEAAE